MRRELERYNPEHLYFSVSFDTAEAEDVRYLCDGACIEFGELKITYYDGFSGRVNHKFALRSISNLSIEPVDGFEPLKDADVPVYFMRPQRQI